MHRLTILERILRQVSTLANITNNLMDTYLTVITKHLTLTLQQKCKNGGVIVASSKRNHGISMNNCVQQHRI